MGSLQWALPRALVVLLIAGVALGIVYSRPAHAQEARVEIASIEHDPQGSLDVMLTVDREAADLLEITAWVDGVPNDLDRGEIEPAAPISVVLAVDVSGSMAGAPIAAAREAARRLVAQLRDGDEVAVVLFASQPQLLVPFTTDRARVHTALESMTAAGDTALYNAVSLSASLLSQRAADRMALVLLSDGVDSGGEPGNGQRSMTDFAGIAAPVYAFALGEKADVAYLSALAEQTDGLSWEVPDDEALSELFTRLGGRLGASATIRVSVPPLALGRHTLTLRISGPSGVEEAAGQFEVTNDGVLDLQVVLPTLAADPVEVRVISTIPVSTTQVFATIDGEPLAVLPGSDVVILVDPWEIEPGIHTVKVQALVSGALLAASEAKVEVPPLEPLLTLQRSDQSIVARARYQPGMAETLVAIVDGEETTRSEHAELVFSPLAGASEVTLELRAASGDVLASDTLILPSAPPADSLSPLTLGLLLTLLTAGAVGIVLWMQRKPGRREAGRIMNRRRAREAPRTRAALDVVVTMPDGDARHYSMGLRPFTIGGSPDCDVFIDDQDLLPLHVRISPAGEGRFQVHGMGVPSARPYEGHSADQWLVIRFGETIEVGQHHVSIEKEPSAPAEPSRLGSTDGRKSPE